MISNNSRFLPSARRRAGILLLLACLALPGMLAGCKQTSAPTGSLPTVQPSARVTASSAAAASTPESSPAPSITQASNFAVTPSALRGIKLTFGHTLTGEAAAALNTLEARFNASNPWGIWVEAAPYSGYVALSQAAREGSVDIAGLPVEYLASLQEEGAPLADLEPYLEDPVWGLGARRIGQDMPVFWQAFDLDGFQAAAPFNPSIRFLVYNQTWASELGFDESPQTLEDFQEQACAAGRQNLTDEHWVDRGTGGWVIDSDPQTILNWISAFGGQAGFGPGQDMTFNTSQSREAFAWLRQLFDQGCIWTAKKSDHASYLAGRQAIFISADAQDIPRFAYEMAKVRNDDTWTLIPFPRKASLAAATVGGAGLAVFDGSDERRMASWLFVRWMQEPDNQAIFIKGAYSLPTSLAVLEGASRQMGASAPWLAAANSLEDLQTGPRQAQWLSGRDVLEDGFLALFKASTQTGDETSILEQVDSILSELASRLP